MSIVLENNNYKKVIKVSNDDCKIFTLDKEPRAELLARRKAVEEEFKNIAIGLDLDSVLGLVPIKIKASFIKDYKAGGEL
jgi:hypothetical protein